MSEDDRIDEPPEGFRQEVHLQSIVSARTMTGMVQMRWPPGSKGAQLSVEAARQYGLRVLECAEAAARDEGMTRWAMDPRGLDLPIEKAMGLLASYRDFRGDSTADWRDPETGTSE